MKFSPNPGIMDIKPYVPGESKSGAAKIIKLSSNENPLGPSPKAMAAYLEAVGELNRYPDGGSTELRQALAKKHGIDAACIVCGTGSDELISLLCESYCSKGDEVLYSEHGFLMYPIAAQAVGATPVKAPEDNRQPSLQNYLDSITAKTKIIFLTNPSVPAGMVYKKSDILNFCEKVPEDIILVIDSAYAEYVEDADYSDGKELVERFDNVIMLRTFSKIYGLGGMRIGWSYSSREIADVLNRVRGIFNVTLPSQRAAVAALEDTDFVADSIKMNSEQRDWISAKLQSLGFIVYPSQANFLLFFLGSAEKAAGALEYLKQRGILLRGMNAYNLSDCLRLTIGLPEDMQAVYEALKDFTSLGEA